MATAAESDREPTRAIKQASDSRLEGDQSEERAEIRVPSEAHEESVSASRSGRHMEHAGGAAWPRAGRQSSSLAFSIFRAFVCRRVRAAAYR